MRSHTLRLLACCTSVLAVFSLVPPSAGQAAGRTLHLSPAGNDGWSGHLAEPNAAGTDGPLATVDRARERVRELKAGDATSPITVLFRAGTYRQDKPLVFTAADSGSETCPITYAAYPGEKAAISGGFPISGWVPEGRLWRAAVPKTPAGTTWRFNQLFVNGERRIRARIPNKGSFLRTDGPVGSNSSRAFYFKEGDLQEWSRLSDVIVVVYHSWETSIHHIRTVDTDACQVSLREPAPWPMGRWEKQQRYYVENVFEGLDEPGEWYLNPDTETLYYYPMPGETPATTVAVAPVVVSSLVEIKGEPAKGEFVDHLHFRGIAFQHSNADLRRLKNPGQGEIYQPGLIQAVGLRQSSFEDCEIAHTAVHGIWFAAGCTDNRIQRCHIHDMGGGGVYIGGGWGINDNTPAGRMLVDNNYIHDGGLLFHGAHGVWIGKSSHNTVTHNEISNLDYSGISCGWSWGFQPSTANHNILDYNYIHHLSNGEGLSDMGGIYTLGLSPGTTKRYNHIHDIYHYPYVSHGSGIYPDEGSTDILIEGNVVHRVGTSPLFMHYGMECTVRNNILALGGAGQLRRSREDKRCHYIAEGNIVYGGENRRMLDGPWKNGDWQVGRNLYWSTGGEPDFAGMDFAAWQVHGKDAGSIVADPLFVDPENGDFRLRPESPALAMGFQPIDVSKAGLYGDPAWTDLPKKYPNRPRVMVPPPVVEPLLIHFDFEGEDVGGEPVEGTIIAGSNGASIRVSDETAAGGKRSLKFTDAPDQQQTWTPHVFYKRTYSEGKVRFAWDMHNSAEKPASFFIELRQYKDASPFLVGPTVSVAADGSVTASRQAVGTIPLGQWAHVQIDIELGPEAPKTYRFALTAPGMDPVVRELPYLNPTFRNVEWLGIASTSETASVFHIDNLQLGTAEELAQPPKRRPVAQARARKQRGPGNDQMLMGHWTFEENDTYAAKDHSGFVNDAEIFARLATGSFGTALACMPPNSYMAVGDDETIRFGTGDFAVELWMCPTMLAINSHDARRRFFSKNDYPRNYLGMDISAAGRVIVELVDGNKTSFRAEQSGALPENAWTHLAVVVDRTNKQIRFYLNGALDCTRDLPANFTGHLDVAGHELTIGSNWQPFVGLLDEIRIFKRTLGEAEIKASYESQKAKRTSTEYQILE